jgi:CheY-like chemotaxis protein
VITSLDQCPRVTDADAAHQALAPTPYAAIAAWADGHTSLRQLNRRLGGDNPAAIGHCLHQGHQAGWLQLAPAPAPEPDSSTPPSILYVGDDPDLSQPIALDLRAHGYEICVEANPFTALNYICDSLPDLILCDRTLPSLPGPTFAALVRQLPGGDRLPFILIQPHPEILDSSLITLTKPCTTRMLLTLIPQHLPPKKRLRK